MARIRSVKPEFWSSEQVMECSPMARLLFIGLWNFCDDAGNHVNSERTIKAQVFPGDDITSTDVRRLLDELSSNELIAFYVHDGKDYLHVTGWKKHQRIDRPTYKHPPYPGDQSEPPRRALDERSPPDRSGGEGSGEEEEQSSLRSDSSAPLALTPDPPPPADLPTRKATRIRQVAEDAQAAYNSILAKPHGLLVACTVLNKPRLKAVEKALPTARQICRQLYGSERVTPDFWRALFETAADDDFHSGRKGGGPGHENWQPDFEFLLREAVIAKLFDRAMTEAAA